MILLNATIGAEARSPPLGLLASTASTPGRSIEVAIASSRSPWRAELALSLSVQREIRVVGNRLTDADALLSCLTRRHPHVLILDVALLDALPHSAQRAIPYQSTGLHVLLLCDAVVEGLVQRILRLRFSGFVLSRDAPEVCAKAIRTVSRGELWLPRALLANAVWELQHALNDEAGPEPIDGRQPLTRRESEVVQLLRQGFSNKEIARRLGIMEDTVKKHLQSVFAKLGVHRRSLVMLRQAARPSDR